MTAEHVVGDRPAREHETVWSNYMCHNSSQAATHSWDETHKTAKNSTAQHNTTQHNTAQVMAVLATLGGSVGLLR